ncbi:MAG: FGGY family carbohydrate kinase, partial [Ruthenibacterium sp.]
MARILALDLGSTQLKLLVMDEGTNVLYVDTQGYATQTPRAGWLEQRPADWCAALRRGMQKLNEHFGICALDAISFSGHMSGVVLISAQGEPLYPCIMLADSRSETQCAALREKAGDIICAHTGNPVLNAFSLPKLQWLK